MLLGVYLCGWKLRVGILGHAFFKKASIVTLPWTLPSLPTKVLSFIETVMEYQMLHSAMLDLSMRNGWRYYKMVPLTVQQHNLKNVPAAPHIEFGVNVIYFCNTRDTASLDVCLVWLLKHFLSHVLFIKLYSFLLWNLVEMSSKLWFTSQRFCHIFYIGTTACTWRGFI